MNKIATLTGATLFPISGAFAALNQPSTPLQDIFYRAAWNEYAENISLDMGDPQLIQTMNDDEFHAKMYKAIGDEQKTFNYTYSPYTIDDPHCVHMQITNYIGTFSIKAIEANTYRVSL